MSGGITLLRVTHSDSGRVLFQNEQNPGYYGLTGMKRAVSAYDNRKPRRYKPLRSYTSSTGDLRRISANGRDSPPRIPPKEPILSSKLKKPAPPVPTITTTAPVETIAEEEITIPKDGCLYNFTADEMATFFRHMRIEDRLVNHLNRKGLNGKRFASITDSELESCGLNNPVLKYFRDRSMKKLSKGKMNFLL